MPPNGEELWSVVKSAATGLGLDRIAVADPQRKPDPAGLDRFLAEGRQAGMDYLARHRDVRLNPDRILPGVRSIVCVAVSYRPSTLPADRPAGGSSTDFTSDLTIDGFAPGSAGGPARESTMRAGDENASCAPVPARIASYALGEDYHRVLKDKLHRLLRTIQESAPGVHGRVAVDTAPVLERHWAREAGLGWIGRHGCLIVPGLGSFVLLGELFLDLALPAGQPVEARCGTCRRCLEACPTDALIGPARLDARRCISYWTVEHRGDFPESAPKISPWVFGCDRCQEVCPWNRHAPPAACAELSEPLVPARAAAQELREVTPEVFKRVWMRTPIERAGWEGLQRNVLRLLDEAGNKEGP